MCGDDPIGRDPTATPRRLDRCEACGDYRLGVEWHRLKGDQALCPRCARDWRPEPPLRSKMLGLPRRNLWPDMPADDGAGIR